MGSVVVRIQPVGRRLGGALWIRGIPESKGLSVTLPYKHSYGISIVHTGSGFFGGGGT